MKGREAQKQIIPFCRFNCLPSFHTDILERMKEEKKVGEAGNCAVRL
jgi:hypothetical protein